MTVQEVKSLLQAYLEAERYFDIQTERLDVLRAKLKAVGSPRITDMPKAPSPSMDRLTVLMQRKIDLEARVKSIRDDLATKRARIEKALEKIPSAEQKSVIQMRYLDQAKWDQINLAFFGKRPDFTDKLDTYLRRVMIIHGQALQALAEIL